MLWTTTIAGIERTFDVTAEQLDIANMALEDYRLVGPAVAAMRYVLPIPLVDALAIVQCAQALRTARASR